MSRDFSLLETPRLNLCLHGFDPQQQAMMATCLLKQNHEHEENLDIFWTVDPRLPPDAWLFPTEKTAQQFFSQKGQKPYAVLWELGQENMAQSPEDFCQKFFLTLMDLPNDVQDICVQYTLASMLIERYNAGDSMTGVWQITADNVLIAVVDFFQLQVAMRPETHFLELEDCAWVCRSQGAFTPLHFQKYSLETVLWHYTQRTSRDLFLKRYQERMINLRRFPRLTLPQLGEHALLIVSLLRNQAMSFQELLAVTGMPSQRLRQQLASLHFAGSLTTKPMSLWRQLRRRLMLKPDQQFFDSSRDTTNALLTSGLESSSLPAGPVSVMLRPETR